MITGLLIKSASAAGLVPCGGTGEPACGQAQLYELIRRVINFGIQDLAFPLVVLFFLIGGVILLTSSGNPTRIEQGKKAITGAVIGLVIVLTSVVLINTLIVTFTKCNFPANKGKIVVGIIDCNLTTYETPTVSPPKSSSEVFRSDLKGYCGEIKGRFLTPDFVTEGDLALCSRDKSLTDKGKQEWQSVCSKAEGSVQNASFVKRYQPQYDEKRDLNCLRPREEPKPKDKAELKKTMEQVCSELVSGGGKFEVKSDGVVCINQVKKWRDELKEKWKDACGSAGGTSWDKFEDRGLGQIDTLGCKNP